MKNKIITSLLLSSLSLFAYDSIYDGTGSLIHPSISDAEIAKNLAWGANKDEADMQVHKDKTSTVSFQILADNMRCDHVDIHAGVDLKQDVIINVKSWDNEEIQESYRAKLPVGNISPSSANGVSIDTNERQWTTLSVTTTKPISQMVPIYAFCKYATEQKNTGDLTPISTTMTKLSDGYYYLGNGSLISALTTDNGQKGYGIKKDEVVSSLENKNGESAFQIRGSSSCKEVIIQNNVSSNGEEENTINSILYKGWDEKDWRQSGCNSLPCTLKVPFSYMLVKIQTEAGNESHLDAFCKSKSTTITVKDTHIKHKHPNSCKFNDVNSNTKYKEHITALCSAEILHGYSNTNYTKYGPENITSWQELLKVVHLAENFHKTRAFADSYNGSGWGAPYLELAKKEGFSYSATSQVTQGIAFRYIAKVFWNKELSEQGAVNLLKKKITLHSTNVNSSLKRGYLAYLVLKSARVSGDEYAVSRKLTYKNHDEKDLDSKSTDIPKSKYENPNPKDSAGKRKEKTENNIEESQKSNVTIDNNKETDTLGDLKNILGDNLKEKYKNANNTKEFIEQAKDGGVYIGKSYNSISLRSNDKGYYVNYTNKEEVFFDDLENSNNVIKNGESIPKDKIIISGTIKVDNITEKPTGIKTPPVPTPNPEEPQVTEFTASPSSVKKNEKITFTITTDSTVTSVQVKCGSDSWEPASGSDKDWEFVKTEGLESSQTCDVDINADKESDESIDIKIEGSEPPTPIPTPSPSEYKIKNLTASDERYFGEIKLTWERLSHSVKEYHIYRDNKYLFKVSWDDNSYVDRNVMDTKKYSYKVRAKFQSYSDIEFSKFSDTKEGTVKKPPVNLKASDGDRVGSIKISWERPAGGYNVQSYILYRATSENGTYSNIQTISGSLQDSHDSNIEEGKKYYYKVRAYDARIGGHSGYSNKNSGYSRGNVKAPAGVKASDGSYTDKIKISWNSVSGASKYYIYRATSSSGSYSMVNNTSSTYYDDRGVTVGKKYYYKVKAYNSSAGKSNYSSYSSGYTKLGDDTTKPKISLISPSSFRTFHGNFTLKVKATDNRELKQMGYAILDSSGQYYQGVKEVISVSGTSVTKSFTVNVSALETDANYKIAIQAKDKSDNIYYTFYSFGLSS